MHEEQVLEQEEDSQHGLQNDQTDDDNNDCLEQELSHVKDNQHDESKVPVLELASSESSHSKDFSGEQQHKAPVTVTLIYTVGPQNKEQFYLRPLLQNVMRAISYGVVKSRNGKRSTSFRKSCKRRGLMIDNTKWKNTR